MKVVFYFVILFTSIIATWIFYDRGDYNDIPLLKAPEVSSSR